MIFILAGSYKAAKMWAESQHLNDDEWFATLDVDDLKMAKNFHVIIHESAQHLSPGFFEKIYSLAHERGRIGR